VVTSLVNKCVQGYINSEDGIPLFYRYYLCGKSRKTAILCLPGLTRNSKDFYNLAILLQKERSIICFDFRGRGRSGFDPNWRNYKPEVYIRDVHTLLTVLNIEKVFVIGTSLGGVIAMGMGVAMPTLIKGVLLNDIGPNLSIEGFSAIKLYLNNKKTYKNWQEAAENLKFFFPTLGNYSSYDWVQIVKGSYIKSTDGRILQNWDPKISKLINKLDFTGIDLWPLFLSLRRFPLIVVRGEDSNVLSSTTFAEMVNVIPHIKALSIPGVGHAPTLLEMIVLESLRGTLNEIDNSCI